MEQVHDRTFRVNFSADGLVKLKGRVQSKLHEFMGDYTDDSLVEYVIVLISNGRHREEARSELDVFLGDDSDSFVAWLWDHLTSNIDHYVESQKSIPDETSRPKATSAELRETNISCHPVTDKKQAESDIVLTNRRNRKWRALTRKESEQPYLLLSHVMGKVEDERKASQSGCHLKRPVSSSPPAQRKRTRGNEHERPKPTMAAPTRLLQCAVLDALATTKPFRSVKESGAKRLHSMVSTSNDDAAQQVQPHRIQSTAGVSGGITTAFSVLAEGAEYGGKARSTRNVFDRLNHGADIPESAEEVALFRDKVAPDLYGGCYYQKEEIKQMDYYHPHKDNQLVGYYRSLEKSRQMHVDYTGKYIGDATILQSGKGLAFDSASCHEGYDGGINLTDDRIMGATQTGLCSTRKRNNSHMVQYRMTQNADQVSHQAQLMEQDTPVSAATASGKILKTSTNVNKWKPPHYPPVVGPTQPNTRRSLRRNEVVGKSSVRFMKENKNSLTPFANEKTAIQKLNETQRSTSDLRLYSTGDPLEDSDDRTIYVNNVHYAATKDSLSQHFNKFGEVLKVTILTDARTGLPKGSAYVEFICKVAAENAQSLDGTSFMSRILKVVKKSSAQQDASTTLTYPGVPKGGSGFAAARFSLAPSPGAYRSRPPAKWGTRSMQWKRDTQLFTSQNVSPVICNKSNAPTVAGHGFTYIRSDTTPTANPGPV